MPILSVLSDNYSVSGDGHVKERKILLKKQRCYPGVFLLRSGIVVHSVATVVSI